MLKVLIKKLDDKRIWFFIDFFSLMLSFMLCVYYNVIFNLFK